MFRLAKKVRDGAASGGRKQAPTEAPPRVCREDESDPKDHSNPVGAFDMQKDSNPRPLTEGGSEAAGSLQSE